MIGQSKIKIENPKCWGFRRTCWREQIELSDDPVENPQFEIRNSKQIQMI